MTTGDRWHCRWSGCDYKHPVGRMVEDHERVCEWRTDGDAQHDAA